MTFAFAMGFFVGLIALALAERFPRLPDSITVHLNPDDDQTPEQM